MLCGRCFELFVEMHLFWGQLFTDFSSIAMCCVTVASTLLINITFVKLFFTLYAINFAAINLVLAVSVCFF